MNFSLLHHALFHVIMYRARILTRDAEDFARVQIL